MSHEYELTPMYDARQSFYGKARVKVDDDGTKRLISYSTEVAVIKDGEAFIKGFYSQTTTRHIREFLKQEGFKAESKKQMAKDYLVKE